MKKLWVTLCVALLAAVVVLTGCGRKTDAPSYTDYVPGYDEGNTDFDFPSNAFSADVTLDGKLDDARWRASDVITLGTWDDADVQSGEYGAIVCDVNNYADTKRAVIRMFRGTVGLHFGVEVRDPDVTYLRREDGDAAIWSDNVLINLCTAIDGATVPMSDDYYFLVTAYGNYCFRRGANAAGMWGAWSGVLDYEASLTYEGETVTGFGVELVVPYAQVGLTKDSPVGVTFRSCDRVTSLNAMLEREWYYKGGAHEFNTPNGYVIWGEDNELYSYYDYAMPNVTINGRLMDYVTGEPLANVRVGGTTTDNGGAFTLTDVNANVDLTLTASGDDLLGDQSFTVSRDDMRVLKGGVLSISEKLLTKANTVTQTVYGTVTSVGSLDGVTVRIGDTVTPVAQDGTYSLRHTFTSAVAKLEVQTAGGATLDREISVTQALAGKINIDVELPVMTLLSQPFGASGNARAYLGWTSDGLYVRVTNLGATNGFGVAYSADGETGKVVLYHQFGTMCVTDFVSQTWDYQMPANFGIDAQAETLNDGTNVYTFVIPYGRYGIPRGTALKIAPFEYTAAGSFAWYADADGTEYPFGNASVLTKYPTLAADGSVTFAPPLTVESTYDISAFGNSNATVKFEKVSGVQNGIRVTVNYTAGVEGFWGFGVIFHDGAKGTTDLFVPSVGTVDHKVYGDWNWTGNYVLPSTVGVELGQSSDGGHATLTLFYGYETLASAGYGLNITADTQTVGIQMFEYVTSGSANRFANYNSISVDGMQCDFDVTIVQWNTAA